jgi:hypothetical protein
MMDDQHECVRLRWFLEQIAYGDMPRGYHVRNYAWWFRGLARQALRQEEWGTIIEEPAIRT